MKKEARFTSERDSCAFDLFPRVGEDGAVVIAEAEAAATEAAARSPVFFMSFATEKISDSRNLAEAFGGEFIGKIIKNKRGVL
jgi:hypothetical protein